MGNNFDIQSPFSESTVTSSEVPWSSDFTLLDKEPSNSTFILSHNPSGKTYQIKQMILTKSQYLEAIQPQIDAKTNKPSPFLIKLEKVQSFTEKNYCSEKEQLFLMYKHIDSNLKEEILNRKFKGETFLAEEILLVIEAGVKGLTYLSDMGNPHNCLSTSDVLISTDRAILINDPWLSHRSKSTISCRDKETELNVFSEESAIEQQYPSPQKILFMNDLLNSYNEWFSSLFTLGMIAMEMAFLQPMQEFYEKSGRKIYYHKIKAKIQQIEFPNQPKEKVQALKQDISRLLAHEPRIRESVFFKYKKVKSDYLFLGGQQHVVTEQQNKQKGEKNQSLYLNGNLHSLKNTPNETLIPNRASDPHKAQIKNQTNSHHIPSSYTATARSNLFEGFKVLNQQGGTSSQYPQTLSFQKQTQQEGDKSGENNFEQNKDKSIIRKLDSATKETTSHPNWGTNGFSNFNEPYSKEYRSTATGNNNINLLGLGSKNSYSSTADQVPTYSATQTPVYKADFGRYLGTPLESNDYSSSYKPKTFNESKYQYKEVKSILDESTLHHHDQNHESFAIGGASTLNFNAFPSFSAMMTNAAAQNPIKNENKKSGDFSKISPHLENYYEKVVMSNEKNKSAQKVFDDQNNDAIGSYSNRQNIHENAKQEDSGLVGMIEQNDNHYISNKNSFEIGSKISQRDNKEASFSVEEDILNAGSSEVSKPKLRHSYDSSHSSNKSSLQTPQRYPFKGRQNSTIREVSEEQFSHSINHSNEQYHSNYQNNQRSPYQQNSNSNSPQSNQKDQKACHSHGQRSIPSSSSFYTSTNPPSVTHTQSQSQSVSQTLSPQQYQSLPQNLSQTTDSLSNQANSINSQSHHRSQTYEDGSKYIGEWMSFPGSESQNGAQSEQSKKHGFGVLYYPDGKVAYEGTWNQDDFHGKGKLYNPYPVQIPEDFNYQDLTDIDEYWEVFEGTFNHDQKEGKGKMKLYNGEIYIGEFHQDLPHGKAKYYLSDGSIVEGIWQNAKLQKVLAS